MTIRTHNPARSAHRQRGAAAILAMMFLVIFSSLAAAMAIIAQGNLATADAHIKITRTLATAETGMHFIVFRLEEASQNITTPAGLIYDPDDPGYDAAMLHPDGDAKVLWAELRTELLNILSTDYQYQSATFYVDSDGSLSIPEIALSPGEPRFSVKMTPHPLTPLAQYDEPRYKQSPYSTMTPAVSSTNPLDATWVRVAVTAVDGDNAGEITRSITMDFKLDKKVRYALLSKSRVMIGKNVQIDGPVGSRFMDTHLTHGHPIQMVSDFTELDPDLDAKLDALRASLVGGTADPVTGFDHHDLDGDNRLQIGNFAETGNLDDPATPLVNEAEELDTNGDGYIDDYDFFLAHFGHVDSTTGRVGVNQTDLETGGLSAIEAQQLIQLIDESGPAGRDGFGDGVIDALDAYAKLRGEIQVAAARADWEAGAAGGAYQQYIAGPISPDHKEDPITFESEATQQFNFDASDFNVAYFKSLATGDLDTQAVTQAMSNPGGADPEGPQPLGREQMEEVPFGAAHPYDYYNRPIYENMTFSNVRIPKGTNALFKNCRFIGVTYIESEADIVAGQPDYNYAGMQFADGTIKHPDRYILRDPEAPDEESNRIYDTKTVSNNLRFVDCVFEGGIVTDAPNEYAHVRNKIAFTGDTKFEIDESPNLSVTEKRLYKRSTILAPHYSVELGTFVAPEDSNEVVNLSGTIVAGVLDMRGQVHVKGSIITTFEPVVGEGPVMGDTTPQFNTTLGYFSRDQGDLEAELPVNGLGIIRVEFDPTIPMPDGIDGPIELAPDWRTYHEETGL